MRLINADEIIFHEIDEIGGEYEPYLGCSKSQIYSLPPVEAIPKAEYEARLKADMVAVLTELQLEIEERVHYKTNDDLTFVVDLKVLNDLIEQKIDKLKGEQIILDKNNRKFRGGY